MISAVLERQREPPRSLRGSGAARSGLRGRTLLGLTTPAQEWGISVIESGEKSVIVTIGEAHVVLLLDRSEELRSDFQLL